MPGSRKPKVLVAMSGGVDSSLSAALLLEQGYEVIGAFMKNWSGTTCQDGSFQECNWRTERRDAMKVAAQLNIPFLTYDFEEEYRAKVVDNLYEEAGKGRTPNPDVLCNKFVKFDLFVREADRLGCQYIATGHYARIESEPPEVPLRKGDAQKEDSPPARGGARGGGRLRILMGTDPNKDQSYFLWAIPPAVLPRVLFPVGGMLKSEVRAKARKLGLPVADKKDSVGICFVGEVEMAKFLKERLSEEPGNIVSVTGEVLGKHMGVNFYTIGQREGLGIGAMPAGRQGGIPYYVVEKRPAKRELVVASNFHPSLFHDRLSASQTNWFAKPSTGDRCQARIRYRQSVQDCTIGSIGEDNVSVRFDAPQRAVTPGQSIVFYDGEAMLGGGIIE